MHDSIEKYYNSQEILLAMPSCGVSKNSRLLLAVTFYVKLTKLQSGFKGQMSPGGSGFC